MNDRLYSFVASDSGDWAIRRINSVTGDSLPSARCLRIVNEDFCGDSDWVLRGVTSNERYVTKAEKAALVAKQEGLGRESSTWAACIPMKKSDAWWALTQEERREIFEEQSQHTQIGMEYLPNIARRLHHCRDLATVEPFDFITWFEYAQADESLFDDLLASLRSGIEWQYVEREVDIRLVRR